MMQEFEKTFMSKKARAAARKPKLLPPLIQQSRAALIIIIAINFMNYLDRSIFVAVGPALKRTFHFNDAQVGMVATSFLLVYTLSALPMGLLADRTKRNIIIALGVAAWSVATWYTAIAHNFLEIFLGRAILGIGEASYVPAGVALLSAYYASAVRGRIMGIWSASTMIGTAVGFVLGGYIAQHFGWQFAFVLCGPPGLLLAWFAWRIPNRMAYDEKDLHAHATIIHHQKVRSLRQSLIEMYGQMRIVLGIPMVRYAIGIQALGLFVVTPAIIFVPIYLREHFHMSVQSAALLTGGLLIPGGVIGTLLGGILADRLQTRFPGGRMYIIAVSLGGAAPFFFFALLSNNLSMLLIFAFIAITLMNMYNGPMTAIVQDIVPADLRSSASAVTMTFAHLLGDVASPTLVGLLVGRSFFGLGTINIAHSLAIFCTPALILGGILSIAALTVYAPADARTKTQIASGGA